MELETKDRYSLFGIIGHNCCKFLNEYSTPENLFNEMKNKIIGQEDALRGICVNVWYYLIYIGKGVSCFNSYNTMIVGPSGCGKTEIYRCIKELLNTYKIPCTISDTSSITATGYKGGEKEEVLMPLIESKGLGIVFLDEFDKILIPSYSSTGSNYNYETQASFLTMLEGNDNIKVKDLQGDFHRVSTMNTMFICMGAFEGMKRTTSNSSATGSVGFLNNETIHKNIFDDDENFLVKDIISFGCRSELIGRFNSVYELKPLKKEQKEVLLNKIMNRYNTFFNCEIEILNTKIKDYIIGTEDAVGCRGMEQRLKEYMDNFLFNYSFENKPRKISVFGKNDYQITTENNEQYFICTG